MAEVLQTDYYKFEWNVVKKESDFGRAKVIHWGILGGIALVLILLLKVLNDWLELKTLEFFLMMAGFVVAYIVVIGVFWQKIAALAFGEILRFGLSRSGVVVEGKLIALSRVNHEETEKLIVSHKDATVDWKQIPSLTDEVTRVNLPLDKGHVELVFPNKRVKQRFWQSMERYLKE